MLETIRQFAEEQLAARGEAIEVRTAHARYFAGREADILALWDSPRQREAYEWFAAELANLRTAFRWAADQDDLDTAAAVTFCAGLLGFLGENSEPVAWAEELIEPARAVDHPRLAALLVLAALCWTQGRIEQAIDYVVAGELLPSSRRQTVPFGLDSLYFGVYLVTGEPARCVDLCRTYLASGHDTRMIAWTGLVMSLVMAGSGDEARTAAKGLIEAAEATGNPWSLSYALLACGFAFRDADPGAAVDALRRGLAIAQDTGIRWNESYLALNLADLELQARRPGGRVGLPHAVNSHLSPRRQHPHPAFAARRPRRMSASPGAPRVGGHGHRLCVEPDDVGCVSRDTGSDRGSPCGPWRRRV